MASQPETASKSRRNFLGSIITGVGAAAIFGVGGYMAGQQSVQPPSTTTSKTLTTSTQTVTVSPQKSMATIKIGSPMGVLSASPIMIALEKGLFESVGLKPEIVEIRGSGPSVEALLSGNVDVARIGYSAPMALAAQKGTYLKIITPGSFYGNYRGRQSDLSAGAAIMVRNGLGVKRIADLKGKRIATLVLGSPDHISGGIVLRKAGLDPTKDVEWKEIPFANQAEALGSGQVDAALTVDPFIVFMVDKGIASRLIDPPILPFANYFVAALGDPFPLSGWFSSEDTTKKNPTLLNNFISAYAEAVRWLYSDLSDTYQILGKYLKSDLNTTQKIFLGEVFAPTPKGFTDYELLRPQMQGYVDAGFLPKPVDLTKFLYNPS